MLAACGDVAMTPPVPCPHRYSPEASMSTPRNTPRRGTARAIALAALILLFVLAFNLVTCAMGQGSGSAAQDQTQGQAHPRCWWMRMPAPAGRSGAG